MYMCNRVRFAKSHVNIQDIHNSIKLIANTVPMLAQLKPTLKQHWLNITVVMFFVKNTGYFENIHDNYLTL